MEGDEGIYTCNVMILKTTTIYAVELSELISKFDNVSHMHAYKVIP